MTIRKKPKRRTTITHDMLDVLAKGIQRRRPKVAVARAMFGITVHEPDTGAPIARLNPVPGTDTFTVRWWSGFRGCWMQAEALGDAVMTLEDAGPSISAGDEFWIEVEGSAGRRHPLGRPHPGGDRPRKVAKSSSYLRHYSLVLRVRVHLRAHGPQAWPAGRRLGSCRRCVRPASGSDAVDPADAAEAEG
jgi:hypothetical protein